MIEKRGAFDLAHRVLQLANPIFRYGIAKKLCTRDFHELRDALHSHKKQSQSAIRPEELPILLHAITGYKKIGDRQTMLALQLLTLIFTRTAELINATWGEFDLDNALWVIPAARMKMKRDHEVPLSHQALGILAELKTLAGYSPFVFPGRNPWKPISNNTMLSALYRLGYKGQMTGHGFRAVASTVLNEMASEI